MGQQGTQLLDRIAVSAPSHESNLMNLISYFGLTDILTDILNQFRMRYTTSCTLSAAKMLDKTLPCLLHIRTTLEAAV